jgi:uncharacterized LabA/DUF88 family protein
MANNQAFIDGQNLYLGTTQSDERWRIDLERFRIYLCEKYHANKAYYFLGAVDDDRDKLYNAIQEAGFILSFREHNTSMIGKKKGNVDTDIVFTIMKKVAEQEDFDKIILVSGDGDYIKMVKYLIRKGKFAKLLAPSQASMSSLYRQQVDNVYYDFLDSTSIKNKIELK